MELIDNRAPNRSASDQRRNRAVRSRLGRWIGKKKAGGAERVRGRCTVPAHQRPPELNHAATWMPFHQTMDRTRRATATVYAAGGGKPGAGPRARDADASVGVAVAAGRVKAPPRLHSVVGRATRHDYRLLGMHERERNESRSFFTTGHWPGRGARLVGRKGTARQVHVADIPLVGRGPRRGSYCRGGAPGSRVEPVTSTARRKSAPPCPCMTAPARRRPRAVYFSAICAGACLRPA